MREIPYERLAEGDSAHFDKKITAKDLEIFSILTGDLNPLHLDDEYAGQSQFKQRVVYGLLITSLLSNLAGTYLPGKYSLILKVQSNMRNPCFLDDTVRVEGKISRKIDSLKVIVVKTKITKTDGVVVQDGELHVRVLK